jgi:hypothetical protein
MAIIVRAIRTADGEKNAAMREHPEAALLAFFKRYTITARSSGGYDKCKIMKGEKI